MDKSVQFAVDALVKDLGENDKALKAISPPSPGYAGGLPEPIEKTLKMTKDQVEKAAVVYATKEKEMAAMEAELMSAMAKALADCKAAADKATKAYMDAIKARTV